MSRSIACIAYENGKIFIAKRIDKGDMGNRWEFPGGKLEEGEDCETAIKREMLEEFNVEVEVLEPITTGTFEHKGKLCYLDAYRIKLAHDGSETPFVLTEHTDYKWIDPKEIPSLFFVDSDLKIYPDVIKKLNIN
ncbi:MAG: NUDIX domain-containing protein [Treponema sp.]|nr:NUDIX domain-containing protein [Treponema sp.]